jgi:Uma2 family endonuclease
VTAEVRFTSRDLELMPDDGKRYEIVDGELFVSKQPHYRHQRVCVRIAYALESWCEESGSGQVNLAPGLIFDEDDDVAPDLVWLSSSRLAGALSDDGKLHAAPELVVEVLSPGDTNQRRDREAKLKLYSRRGVAEYWIVDWRLRRIEVYRRERGQLELTCTLEETDSIDSPLLPGFTFPLKNIFETAVS